jgi:hypothetical protein
VQEEKNAELLETHLYLLRSATVLPRHRFNVSSSVFAARRISFAHSKKCPEKKHTPAAEMDWSDPFTICGTDAEREDNDNIDQRRHVT